MIAHLVDELRTLLDHLEHDDAAGDLLRARVTVDVVQHCLRDAEVVLSEHVALEDAWAAEVEL